MITKRNFISRGSCFCVKYIKTDLMMIGLQEQFIQKFLNLYHHFRDIQLFVYLQNVKTNIYTRRNVWPPYLTRAHVYN